MKKIKLSIVCFAFASIVYGQENIIAVNGGYAFIVGQEVKTDLTGWRVMGVYEYNPMGGPLSHGFSFGYAGVSGISKRAGSDFNKTVEVGTWPVYYQPKYRFGNDKLQGYVKGALGWQFSNYNIGISSTFDSGFYGGGGVGAEFNIGQSFFINAEYEVAWMSNYYYRDGWLNSAMGGIGFRF